MALLDVVNPKLYTLPKFPEMSGVDSSTIPRLEVFVLGAIDVCTTFSLHMF
jgi:hypothetical protein